MGAVTFGVTKKAKSMTEAFNELYREAKEEHGHEQGYSGDINSTRLTADKTNEYRAAKDKVKFIKELDERVPKWETWGVELEAPKANNNKVKSSVAITPQKGAKKWETRYVVYDIQSDSDVASEKTQGAAVKKARAHTEKTQHTTLIDITKVMTKGNSRIGRVQYKSSKTESFGKYFFAVCAPE